MNLIELDRALRQLRLGGMAADAIRALGNMGHRYRNELFGLFGQGAFFKNRFAELAEGIGCIGSQSVSLFR